MPIPSEREPDLLCCIEVGTNEDGNLQSVLHFHAESSHPIVATKGSPDLGLDEYHTVLHDAAHLLLCLLSGVGASPVLERAAGVRPGEHADPVSGLSQHLVDLEEAAVFALHAYVQGLQEAGIKP